MITPRLVFWKCSELGWLFQQNLPGWKPSWLITEDRIVPAPTTANYHPIAQNILCNSSFIVNNPTTTISHTRWKDARHRWPDWCLQVAFRSQSIKRHPCPQDIHLWGFLPKFTLLAISFSKTSGKAFQQHIEREPFRTELQRNWSQPCKLVCKSCPEVFIWKRT